MDLSVTQWALMVLAAVIIGFSKTGFTGVGIVAIPIAAMVLPAKESTGMILPMLVIGDVLGVTFYRRHGEWRYLFKLMPCAMVGIILGFLIMRPMHNAQLKPFIGSVILVLLGLNAWRNYRLARSGDLSIPDGWWFAIVMGLIGGIVTMMANAAGPIIVMYLLAMRLPKHAFIGTGAWYFLILNLFKIPFSWNLTSEKGVPLVNVETLMFNAKLAPVIILAGLAGWWLVRYIPEKPFTRMMQVLAAMGAVYLVIDDPLRRCIGAMQGQ